MSSSISYEKCPHCGSEDTLVMELNCRTGEDNHFCMACGYSYVFEFKREEEHNLVRTPVEYPIKDCVLGVRDWNTKELIYQKPLTEIENLSEDTFRDWINYLSSQRKPDDTTPDEPVVEESPYIRITNLDDGVFYNSTIRNITIPDYMTRIGNYTFYNCDTLTISTIENADFLNNIVEIGDYAFAYSDMISFVRIPESVTYVGAHSFENCSSLVEIDIKNAFIGDYMLPITTMKDLLQL